MGKNTEFEPDLPPELRTEMDALMAEYKAVRRKEKTLRRRFDARIALLREMIAEIYEHSEARLGRLATRRIAISTRFLALWSEKFAHLPKVALPSWIVLKRRDLAVEVRDKHEVFKALDRIDRLDLVDFVFDVRAIRNLVRDGTLTRVRHGALDVNEHAQIQVSRRKEV